MCRYRLGVRTRGSQPRNRGSNPRTGTIKVGPSVSPLIAAPSEASTFYETKLPLQRDFAFLTDKLGRLACTGWPVSIARKSSPVLTPAQAQEEPGLPDEIGGTSQATALPEAHGSSSGARSVRIECTGEVTTCRPPQ